MQVTRACPVCGRVDAELYLQKGVLRLERCQRCSMVYVTPVPQEMASGQFYDQEGSQYYLSPAKLESDYAPVRFKRELRLFRKYCPRGRVLDAGCSTGAFLYQLRSRFPSEYEILGTDVSGAPLDYAESRGVPVARGNFLEMDFKGSEFDAVTFWAVLEHLADPAAFLTRAKSVLKPGGLCFVLTPNLNSLAARLLGARYRYIYPQHLNYFSRKTLEMLLERQFSVLEFKSTHFNPVVIWQDLRHGTLNVSNEERALLLKRTTAYKQSPWLWPAKIFYRSTELALGLLTLADNLAFVLRNAAA